MRALLARHQIARHFILPARPAEVGCYGVDEQVAVFDADAAVAFDYGVLFFGGGGGVQGRGDGELEADGAAVAVAVVGLGLGGRGRG